MVVVEILTDSLFHVRLPHRDLKEEICLQEKQLSQDRLILILDRGSANYLIMCENEATLAEYAVRDSSHVYIFFTLPEPGVKNGDHGSLSSAAPLNTHS